ncbi:MAG: Hsp20/alpha crystallin family protein [bacterium]
MPFFAKLKNIEEENSTEQEIEETESTEETEEIPQKEISLTKKKISIKNETAKQDNETRKGKGKKGRWFEAEGQLTVDVFQSGQDLVIQSAIAGIESEDLDISIDKDVVTIKGNRENPETSSGKNYFYQECYWGAFSREIILPVEVDTLRSEAIMKEGVLIITMPIIERERKKKIKIR